jgi:hypothetical protein
VSKVDAMNACLRKFAPILIAATLAAVAATKLIVTVKK